MQNCLVWLKRQTIWSGAVTLSVILAIADSANAQIEPDSSLGSNRSRVTRDVEVAGGRGDRIDRGVQQGNNLFHSFREFNVNENQRVYFTSPPGLVNIFSRITGRNSSNILGTLGVEGTANLYLLNPNGIIFGRNARLDIRGSFIGATANAIGFGEAGIFSATNPELPSPLLTVEPTAFFFNQLPTGNITVRSTTLINRDLNTFGLQVGPGSTLALLGSAINVEAGGLNGPAGRIDLGAVASNGIIGLNTSGFVFPTGIQRGDIIFTNAAKVDVRTRDDGGRISIQARRIRVTEGSALLAGILPRRVPRQELQSQTSNINLNATERLLVEQASTIENTVVFPDSRGVTGDIEINTPILEILDGGRLIVATNGQGNTGNIRINSTDRVTLQGTDGRQVRSAALSTVMGSGNGNGGDIEISTSILEVLDGAELTAETFGRGNVGNVRITATNRVVFQGESGNRQASSRAVSRVDDQGFGNAGNIEINTPILEVSDGAELSTSTNGQGTAGSVIIRSSGRVTFQGVSTTSSKQQQRRSQATAEFFGSSNGRGGNIEISTPILEVLDGAQLNTSTRGQGDAGSIRITASNRVTFQGTNTGDNRQFSSDGLSSVILGGTGNGGNIVINTPILEVLDGARLTVSTFGQGNAGSIRIDADRVILQGSNSSGQLNSAAFSTVQNSGQGGNIAINTSILEVLNGAEIAASTFGRGDAGNIRINAGGRLVLNGRNGTGRSSGLYARTFATATGRGGNVTIRTPQLQVVNGANIDARTANAQPGGSVNISAEQVAALNSGEISVSSTSQGQAGNLIITAQRLLLDDNAKITAETTSGQGGNIDLRIVDLLRLDNNSEISAATEAGRGGRLTIQANNDPATGPTNRIQMSGRSQIATEATATGNAGQLNLHARRLLVRERSAISASTTSGVGGDIILRGLETLQVNNGKISASTQTGQAGSLQVNTENSAQINNRGSLIVEATEGGIAGNLVIRTGQLNLQNRGRISVSSSRQGQAGTLEITAENLRLNNRARITAETDAGNGGDILLQIADLLRLDELSTISASTNNGQGGNLRVNQNRNAVNQIELNNSQITTEARRQGNAGNLALNVEQLFVGKAAEISASTRSGIGGGITLQGLETLEIDAGAITASTRTGEAGNVRINASDSIDLRNQGRLAVEATGSNGEAGNLMISTDEFTIQNGAATVSSAQGRAGNLLLTANSVQLDQARLTAETAQTGGQAGANITLNGLQTLSLRNQSQISANARESANGGNLTINADFILARPTEDSDIRANAIAGNGGNIAITTQGLFGTQPADAPIAGVSDITASSERGIQGVVAINNPNANPTQGLEFAEAPPETIPLAQECAPITELNRERSSFVVVGRGGVSPSPYEALRSDDFWQDWRLTEVETERVNQPVTETSVIQTPDSQMPINEAQGWIRNAAGQVQLVAIAHTASSAPPALSRPDCSDLADLSTQSGAE